MDEAEPDRRAPDEAAAAPGAGDDERSSRSLVELALEALGLSVGRSSGGEGLDAGRAETVEVLEGPELPEVLEVPEVPAGIVLDLRAGYLEDPEPEVAQGHLARMFAALGGDTTRPALLATSLLRIR